MIKAFVFGKFNPFHKGHEAMIKFALSKCDFLSVLVCSSDKENIPCEIRGSWIRKTFEKMPNVEVRVFDYLESELPNTSVTSESVSEVWAKIFQKQFPDYSLLITSEDYGILVADYMNIEHIAFDKPRSNFPISATAVRNELFKNWQFLPDSVKPYFAIKIILLGTESTGKTTLAEWLKNHFKCSLVSEAGRDLIPDSNEFCFEDLQLVVNEHARRIDLAVIADSPLVIIDTDIHITKSYSMFCFEKELEVAPEIYNANKANLYLYLNNDVEYFQDGTRLSKEERDLLDASHRNVLAHHGIEVIEISGGWEERFDRAVECISEILINGNEGLK